MSLVVEPRLNTSFDLLLLESIGYIKKMRSIVWFIVMAAASAFVAPNRSSATPINERNAQHNRRQHSYTHFALEQRPAKATTTLRAKNNNNPISSFFEEIGDMLSSMDDVVDDFVNKRMGNGEVFYGKRKFKPSGRKNTEGKYNGMGLSDKTKIDLSREYKEQRKEELRQQRQREQES